MFIYIHILSYYKLFLYFNLWTTDPGLATGKLYHVRLRVDCTLFCNLQSWAQIHAILVIGLYELLDPTTFITELVS
jgi:hypothetical protein